MTSVIVSSDNLNAVDPEIPIEPDTNHPHIETLPNSDYNNKPDPIRTKPQENHEQLVNLGEEIDVHEVNNEENRAQYTNSEVVAVIEAINGVEDASIQDTLVPDANITSVNL